MGTYTTRRGTIMRHLYPLIGLLVLTLAACGTREPDGATQFVTSITPAPASAKTDKNGVARDDYGRPFSYAFLGKPLPIIKGTSLNGDAIDSSQFDNWTVIDVWGLWCSDCMADSKYVAKFAARAPEEDINFVSLHVPASATRATPEEMFGKHGSVEAYFDKAGFSYPTLVDTDASLRDLLQIAWTPTYLLVSPDGVVRGFRTELSAAGGDPVEDFITDIKTLRASQEGAAAALRDNTSIGPDGVINLSGTTMFTSAALRAAFPDYLVVADSEQTTDGPIPLFRILAPLAPKNTAPLFTIWPDWTRGSVLAVATQNPDVQGPNGIRVGKTRFGDLYKEIDESVCTPSRMAERAMITCRLNEGTDKFTLSFPADTESPSESLLFQMTYLPPGPAQ